MIAIFIKELISFFSSLTGYLAGGVFLLLTALVLWVLPGAYNVVESNEATLQGLFTVAPWLFLFLVPAITMRMFSDERRQGTLQLLYARPVTQWAMVLGKYLAAVVLVVLMLLPTLVHMVLIYLLGAPVGSLDTGATWGSYLGLLLLGCLYASVGVYCSTLTQSGVVAFILGALLCLALYMGFESLATLEGLEGMAQRIASLGIEHHYRSIRRGVVDTRDLLYFLCVSSLFLGLARQRLRSAR